ncbi:phage portal protein [Sinorhizobium meliloti]|uniref:phage portal protein n=1 Tax=Rhizobium meliloti TaxID=382 RepID=UPI000FDAF751|nr:phage portal protein [Sinorhizobium meliloti]RVE90110.1 phage portal protein [Sinorhizobium meliloti]RVH30499.1 phage portal protein [Sinorhizobium meliloti]
MSGEVTILGPDAKPLSPAVRAAARVQVAKNRLMASSAYQGASYDHPSFAKWRPGTWSGQSALTWSRSELVDRLNDVARNDGWGAAGTSRLVDNIIGSGWTLAARPNHVSLNMTFEQAEEIADKIEALWRDYTQDVDKWCDAERTKTMAGVLGLAARQRFGPEGEAFGVIVWQDNAPLFQTAIHVVDPARCSNPNGRMDEEFLRDGVAIDGYGAPVGYHFRKSHPGEFFAGNTGLWHWEYVERETEWGRPIVVHAYEQKRAGMTRGVSDWAPVMRSIKQSTDYEDYESQAAMLNAVMAAFIETPFDPEEMLEAMGADYGNDGIAKLFGEMSAAQKAYYGAAPIDLPGVRINTLQPGEKATLTKPEHPNANFEAFVNAALRKVASAIGVTYEQLTMDWSQVNYSSARAALLEIWRGFTAKKGGFASQFMAPIYRAWLEEVFDKGLVELPAGAVPFEQNPAAWCHADWIGPGRGWIDPLREAQAASERLAGNLTTLQQEAAEQGRDWKMDAQQRARERAFYERLGLDPDPGKPEARSQASAAPPAEPGDETEEEVNGRTSARRHPAGIPRIARRKTA